MSILEFQELLRLLYTEDYQEDNFMRLKMLQLGWAVERLLERNELSLFDDYDEKSKLIYQEADMEQRSRHDRN
ncbi:hypothetical protein ACYCJG_06735 [Staphylococcus chromogenes]|uniref:hypothetical protein n=1 Tax=Staphylococcus chromogenes TaxID=46126 RepID=UPI000D034E3D|nr:hypothetical protein [Staphylococcus chromogenes]MEB7431473.1 hypothetical protein [Staphylococcus chromogenes]PTF39291.1 hypothetical protein BUY17_03820 [Staphylococcus chromogenes]PTF40580.1 hypothetical protein BUY11_11030 [Staphylococcus chromogenes]PTF51524.1 hypothetical protein BUY12_06295 [Staphylococcus chromogenes]PTF63132.1 hypothetical protein BUY10_04450 [Staphylococcus chromogenes]